MLCFSFVEIRTASTTARQSQQWDSPEYGNPNLTNAVVILRKCDHDLEIASPRQRSRNHSIFLYLPQVMVQATPLRIQYKEGTP